MWNLLSRAYRDLLIFLSDLILLFQWGLTFLSLKLPCSRDFRSVTTALTSFPWHEWCKHVHFIFGGWWTAVCVCHRKNLSLKTAQAGLTSFGRNAVWNLTLVLQSRTTRLRLYRLRKLSWHRGSCSAECQRITVCSIWWCLVFPVFQSSAGSGRWRQG